LAETRHELARKSAENFAIEKGRRAKRQDIEADANHQLIGRTLKTACTAAKTTPLAIPKSRPTQGLPLTEAPHTAEKAPTSIMPSRLRFSTPAASLINSPLPASISGTAKCKVEAK
jgi:hypothetical protein